MVMDSLHVSEKDVMKDFMYYLSRLCTAQSRCWSECVRVQLHWLNYKQREILCCSCFKNMLSETTNVGLAKKKKEVVPRQEFLGQQVYR